MRPVSLFSAAALVLLPVLVAPHPARADAATETQLRAALQQATSQIASLSGQVAALQAQQAPDKAQIADLQAQIVTLRQQTPPASTAKVAEPKADEESRVRLASLMRELGARDQALTEARQEAGSARSAAASQQTRLDQFRQASEACATKNAALYKTANDILDEIEKHGGSFSAVAENEPFTGLARVKLQNIIQDKRNVLDDNHVVP